MRTVTLAPNTVVIEELCDVEMGTSIDCWCRPDFICDNRCAAFQIWRGKVRCQACTPPMVIGKLEVDD